MLPSVFNSIFNVTLNVGEITIIFTRFLGETKTYE